METRHNIHVLVEHSRDRSATGSWFQADNFPLSDDFVPNALEDGGARNNSSHRDGKASLTFALTPSGRGEYAVTYVLQRGQKDVPPYAGTNNLVRPRFWQWPERKILSPVRWRPSRSARRAA